MNISAQRRAASFNLIVFSLMLFALGNYLYATLRFAGKWNEHDTALLTFVIHSADSAQSIINASSTYGNGMTYQSISLFIMRFTGVTPSQLQIFIFPALTAFLPMIVFVTYRSFTGNSSTALLATLILFLQPDFLFVTWRGSHERITWTLVSLLLFLLSKSFLSRGTIRYFSRYVIVFFMIAIAFIGSNAFFASSFIAALALSFFGGQVFLIIHKRFHHTENEEVAKNIRRLFYLTTACSVMLYFFFFYVYPPALSLLRAFRSLADGLSALFLHSDDSASGDALDYVTATWVDQRLFLMLTSLSFGILLISFIVWFVGAYGYLRKRTINRDEMPRLFLWLLYPTFALQLVLGVIADRTNAVGSNLQVRLFTPLMLTAVPLVAIGLRSILQVKVFRGVVRGIATVIIACGISGFSILSMIKVTNDPIFSNNWIFSTSPEQYAILWTLEHNANAFDPDMWTGVDIRLNTFVSMYDPEISSENYKVGLAPPIGTRYFIVSDFEQELWKRRSLGLLFLKEDNMIYDNGEVQIYYRRPITPYQR